MNHADHVFLLRKAIEQPGGVWTDLGSGTGAFTLALADLLGPGGTIYSVDKDAGALRDQEASLRRLFPNTLAHYLPADFTRPLELPPLDGVVMANALHFLPDGKKEDLLRSIGKMLRAGGRLVLVEYNADRGNLWVPHPLSYPRWEQMATRCGFTRTRLLEKVPSRFLGEIFSAESRPG